MTGYNTPNQSGDNPLQLPTFGVTENGCANGYSGTAVVTPCSENGPYTLSGCAPIVCTRPDTLGYILSETKLSVADGFDVSVTCADGYGGSPTVDPCSIGGQAYTLSGC